MTESNVPEVDVNELLKEVRVEANRLRTLDSGEQTRSRKSSVTLPKLPALRPFPRSSIPLQPDLGGDQLGKLHDLLERARQAMELSQRVPKPFRKAFRQQDDYNSLLIQSVIPLFETAAKLIQWQQEMSAGLRTQIHWLADLSRARAEQDAWMKAAGRAIRSLSEDIEQFGVTIKQLEEKVETESLSRVGVEQGVASVRESVGGVQESVGAAQQNFASLQHNLTLVQQSLASLEQRCVSDASFIKAELSLQGTLIQRQLQPTAVDSTAASQDETLSTKQPDHRLDAFYFAFENQFRGPREEIKKRIRFYLPFLESANLGSETKPILDVGCGRGEWLELLREQGLTAKGVDLNGAMIAQCRERQLDVVQADALEFLRGVPDKSQGAVTGFHIIEHLPLETLTALFCETFRVLRPGGIAIFESPNCKNLMVGACNFHADPTHRNPVYPETAGFMLSIHGFAPVKLEYLTPVEAQFLTEPPREAAVLNQLLYGPQDFSVIGYKPAEH